MAERERQPARSEISLRENPPNRTVVNFVHLALASHSTPQQLSSSSKLIPDGCSLVIQAHHANSTDIKIAYSSSGFGSNAFWTISPTSGPIKMKCIDFQNIWAQCAVDGEIIEAYAEN